MKTIKLILLSTILLLLKEYAGAQVSFNVPAPNTVINTRRAVVTNINTSNANQYVISYAGNGEAGSGSWPTLPNNRLLIMLMSKTSGPNPTRNWQIVNVLSSNPFSRTVTVTPFAFTNWGTITTTGSIIQIMNVPVYSDVIIDNGGSLTCDPWNDFTGGVLCFIANGKIEVLNGDNDGAFNVAGKGFKQLVVNGGAGGRGGYRSSTNGANSATPGDNGRDAAGANLNPALALSGQGELCFDGASNIKGGNGGLGGTPMLGAVGGTGTPAATNKCSKLLVAYEDDYLEANATVVQMPGCSTTNQDAYRVLKGNFYWAKFNNVSCANCANIIKQFADDLKNNKYDPPTANHSESLTINGLKHDYGTVTFGEGGKFTYADTYPAQEIGVLSEPAKNLVCIKQCTAFNKNWLVAVDSCPCAEPSEEDDDDGGGGWGGSSDPNPAKP
jgi:hypothetical protein